jgi:hypothetical protein
VLAELFQRLEALGHPLGRPQTPAEAAEQLVRWMQGERERSAAAWPRRSRRACAPQEARAARPPRRRRHRPRKPSGRER